MKKTLIAIALALLASLLFALWQEFFGSHGGPEQTLGLIDSTGRIRFVLSWYKQPTTLDALTMWRKADGEPVCIITADPRTGGTVDTWRYGEEPESYKVAGCDTLGPGIYRIEFRSRHGGGYAYGICEVCAGPEGRLSFGGPTCNKGTCAAVH